MSVEDSDACFIVNDRNGFALSYVYYEEEPGRRLAANLMTRDEARVRPPTDATFEPLCR